MNKYDLYITLILLIKLGFILMVISHIYLKFKGKDHSDLDKKILYWKERLEFIFVLLMSFLLIYLFNPRSSRINLVDKETKLLLFLFGFVLLITANWDVFFKQSYILKYLKNFF